jgi:hypothetical protein
MKMLHYFTKPPARKRTIGIFIATAASLLFLTVPIVSSAQAFDPFAKVCDGTTTDSSVCIDKDSTTNPISGNDGVLLTAAKILAKITGVASVIMVLFGSIKYVTASTRDKGESIASAKKTIIYALIGVIVAALGQGLIILVVSKLN